MSDIIDFLEKLGQDATLRNATRSELESALLQSGFDASARAAVLQKSSRELETLLHANSNICCMVARPMREDEDDDAEPDTDKGDSKKDREKPTNMTPQPSVTRRVA